MDRLSQSSLVGENRNDTLMQLASWLALGLRINHRMKTSALAAPAAPALCRQDGAQPPLELGPLGRLACCPPGSDPGSLELGEPQTSRCAGKRQEGGRSRPRALSLRPGAGRGAGRRRTEPRRPASAPRTAASARPLRCSAPVPARPRSPARASASISASASVPAPGPRPRPAAVPRIWLRTRQRRTSRVPEAGGAQRKREELEEEEGGGGER